MNGSEWEQRAERVASLTRVRDRRLVRFRKDPDGRLVSWLPYCLGDGERSEAAVDLVSERIVVRRCAKGESKSGAMRITHKVQMPQARDGAEGVRLDAREPVAALLRDGEG